jgi:hypothetical protein
MRQMGRGYLKSLAGESWIPPASMSGCFHKKTLVTGKKRMKIIVQ